MIIIVKVTINQEFVRFVEDKIDENLDLKWQKFDLYFSFYASVLTSKISRKTTCFCATDLTLD